MLLKEAPAIRGTQECLFPGAWVIPKPENRLLRGLHVPVCMVGVAWRTFSQAGHAISIIRCRRAGPEGALQAATPLSGPLTLGFG